MEIVFSVVLAVPLEQNRRPRLTPTIFEGTIRSRLGRRHVADAPDAVTDGQFAELPTLTGAVSSRTDPQIRTRDVEDTCDASSDGLPPLV